MHYLKADDNTQLLEDKVVTNPSYTDGQVINENAVSIAGYRPDEGEVSNLFPLNVVCTETYLKVLVFDDNRNSLYTNYLYYLYYHRFLLSKPAVTIFLTAKS